MGMTFVELEIRKSRASKKAVSAQFLVDSGAAYTVAPGKMLRRLGIRPDDEQSFFLANDEKVTRKVGEAYFTYEGKAGTSKVIFGQKGDSNLLGALTLEAMGLVLDPLKRELKPLPMLLM
ncbi:MAG TPA: aspartyl protease [Phycisphaerae bacterium]|nr:aspartyl protease [Phycisphaerae bacterium]